MANRRASDWRDDRAPMPVERDAVNQRRGVGIRLRVAHVRQQRAEARAVTELNADRVLARGRVEIARQRNARMPRLAGVPDPLLRAAEDFADGHRGIGGYRHERRIGAVLQQAPHQIGEQVAMPADRRVDAAGGTRLLGDQRFVQRFAHAMQALEFVTLKAACLLDHARDGERIVRGELRIEMRPRGEQLTHAVHVTEVGHRLAGEYRIVGKPALLGALHLRIPIGALDEPHHQAAIQRLRRIACPIDHRACALLVGLDRKTVAFPTRERRISEHRGVHVEREFKPVRLLGIEIMRLGMAREFEHARRQLAQNPLARDRFIARMQRREFDRDARPVRQARTAGRLADRTNRARVALEIALRVGVGARPLAQRVVGIAELAVMRGARKCFLDVLSEHEMRAEQAHRLACRPADRRQAEPLAETFEDTLRPLARIDDTRRNAERPRRC